MNPGRAGGARSPLGAFTRAASAFGGLFAALLLSTSVRQARALGSAASADEGTEKSHAVRVFYRTSDSGEVCLDARVARAGVTTSLGRKVFFPRESSDVIVLVQPQPGFEVVLRLFDAEERDLGTRVLTASDCAELRELLVFSLSVMLDFRTDQVAERRRAAADAAAAKSVTPTPSAPAATQPEKAPPQARAIEAMPPANPASETDPVGRGQPTAPPAGWTLSPGVGVLAQTGLTPLPLGELFVQAVLGRERFGAVLRVQAGLMPEVLRRGGELDAWHAAAALGTCWLERSSPTWAARACLGLTSGWVRVRATGFRDEQRTTFAEVGLEPTLALEVPIGTVHWFLGLGATVPLLRSDWHATQDPASSTSLFRAPPLRFLAFTGVAWEDLFKSSRAP